jgi:hypothetical protein
LTDTEGIANRKHDVADLHGIGIAEYHRWQPGRFDLEQCEIAGGIGPDYLRLEGAAIDQVDANHIRVINHVMVREDESFRGDDDARPKAALLERRRVARTAKLVPKEPAKKVVVWPAR